MSKIISVVGTRPNFIKIAPLIKEISRHLEINHLLVHTGQHYDDSMSKFFFDDLRIPRPDMNLNVGSASDAVQTAKIMQKFEKVIIDQKPDLVIVVGDVNSTFAAALAAKKCAIKVAHVEAGLRSFDMSMPEELNRILTDHISDLLFTTEQSANENLLREGILENVYFVGNVMIDSLLEHREMSMKSNILSKLKIKKKSYWLLTLHRPSNVDSNQSHDCIIDIISKDQQNITMVFPVHPRTIKQIRNFGLEKKLRAMPGLIITEPLGYIDFLHLMDCSKFTITDSGGIQEETTVLKVPCITLRNNTERPATITNGTNMLVSTNKDKVLEMCKKLSSATNMEKKTPSLWDGKAAKRIMKIIIRELKI